MFKFGAKWPESVREMDEEDEYSAYVHLELPCLVTSILIFSGSRHGTNSVYIRTQPGSRVAPGVAPDGQNLNPDRTSVSFQ